MYTFHWQWLSNNILVLFFPQSALNSVFAIIYQCLHQGSFYQLPKLRSWWSCSFLPGCPVEQTLAWSFCMEYGSDSSLIMLRWPGEVKKWKSRHLKLKEGKIQSRHVNTCKSYKERSKNRTVSTCSRKWRERFIYLASVSSTPFRPVLLTLSEPARSTRWSLDRCRVAEPGSRLQRCTVKMQWERVEAWFRGVWGGPKKWQSNLKKTSNT